MSSGNPSVDAIGIPTTSDDDELMTRQHKDQLAARRDELVANMYPDDLLNRLQSRKVLNTRDVTRIKEKQQIEGQVELLLDTLMRKPDRAYIELITALNETDQKHVAKLLIRGDKNSTVNPSVTPSNSRSRINGLERDLRDNRELADGDDDDEYNNDNERDVVDNNDVDDELIRSNLTRQLPIGSSGSRKRKAGTVRLSVTAADIDSETDNPVDATPAKRKSRSTTNGMTLTHEARQQRLIDQLNTELLEITRIELRNLQEVVKAGSDPKNLARRKPLHDSIQQLMKYRREIIDVYEGSVILCIRCLTLRALRDLLNLCTTGRLLNALRRDFVTEKRLARLRIRNFHFRVTLCPDDYRLCEQELLAENLCPAWPWSDAAFTPPLVPQTKTHKSSVSPDSGISSQPSPISPSDKTFESQHAMVLRSRRVGQPITNCKTADHRNHVVHR